MKINRIPNCPAATKQRKGRLLPSGAIASRLLILSAALAAAGGLKPSGAHAQPATIINPAQPGIVATRSIWAQGYAPSEFMLNGQPVKLVAYHPQVTAFFCGAAAMEMELDCTAVRNNNAPLDIMLGNGVAGANPAAAVVDGMPTKCFPAGPGAPVCWTQPGNYVQVGPGMVPTTGVQSFMYSLVHGGFPGNYKWNGNNYINPSPMFGGFGPFMGTSLDELTAGLNLMDSPANNAGIHNYVAYNLPPVPVPPNASRADWANRTMADGLAQLGIPAAAVVHGGAHWVCVIGAKTDVAPVAMGQFKIYGFYIQDPWDGYQEAMVKQGVVNDPQGRPLLPGLGEQKFCSTAVNPNRGKEDDIDWDSIFNPAGGPPLPLFGSGLGYKFEVEPIGPVPLDTGNNGQYNSIPDPSPILTNAPLTAQEALVFATNSLAGDAFLSSQPGFTNGTWVVTDAMLVRYATDGTNEGDWLLPYEGAGGTNDVTGFVMIDMETGDLDEAVWMNPGDVVPSMNLSDVETMETDEFAGIFPDDNTSAAMLNLQLTSTNSVVLTWSASSFITYSLQQNFSLTTTNWVTLTNVPTVVSNMNQVILPATAAQSFFRLITPVTGP